MKKKNAKNQNYILCRQIQGQYKMTVNDHANMNGH